MEDNSRFYIPVLSFLVLACFVLLAIFVDGPSAKFQDYICEPNRCTLQDWLSATAGWVGFAAAAVAAYLVFGQLAEQRKQTAFMLGDAEPTLEQSVTAMTNRRGEFEFVNWNRRRATVEALRFFSDEAELPAPQKIKVKFSDQSVEEVLQVKPNHTLEFGLSVTGWTERQSAPHKVTFEIWFEDEVEDFTEFLASTDEWAKVVVSIVYEIEGSRALMTYSTPLTHLLPVRG